MIPNACTTCWMHQLLASSASLHQLLPASDPSQDILTLLREEASQVLKKELNQDTSEAITGFAPQDVKQSLVLDSSSEV